MSRTNGVSVLPGKIGIHVLRYRDIGMIGHISVGACE